MSNRLRLIFFWKLNRILEILKENNLLEWFEAALLLATATVFFASAKLATRHRSLRIFLGLIMLALLMRELDSFIENVLFNRRKTIYYVPVITLLACAFLYALVRFRLIWAATKDFICTRSFIIFTFGLAIVFCVAQFLGQRSLWRMMLRHNSSPESYKQAASVAKNFVEENLEILGYFYLLFGAVEDAFTRRKRRRMGKSAEEESS